MRNRQVLFLPIAVVAIGLAASCASKGYVKTQVEQVNTKVDTLSQGVESAQEQGRQNSGRITEVDQKTTQAQNAADQANRAAGAADARANAAATKADDIDRASRRLVFTVVLSEDEGNFKSGKFDLPDDAKKKIDAMVAQLTADPKGAYFEIEGHTDATGPKDLNDKLGMERADAVKRYLYMQHQIPLHKMNVISYGAEKPVAPNSNKDGRAQNRRVVIRVLI